MRIKGRGGSEINIYIDNTRHLPEKGSKGYCESDYAHTGIRANCNCSVRRICVGVRVCVCVPICSWYPYLLVPILSLFSGKSHQPAKKFWARQCVLPYVPISLLASPAFSSFLFLHISPTSLLLPLPLTLSLSLSPYPLLPTCSCMGLHK